MPPRTGLWSTSAGGIGGDCSEADELQTLGHRDHPQYSRYGATMSIQPDYACLGCGAAYGSGPSARDPGRIVGEAWHASSRCG